MIELRLSILSDYISDNIHLIYTSQVKFYKSQFKNGDDLPHVQFADRTHDALVPWGK